MSFAVISKAYLRELQAQVEESERTGQHTPELSYKPALDKYFRALASLFSSEIFVVFEPKTQAKAGHPDWRFHNIRSLGVYGYVEGKPLQREGSLSLDNFQEQVSRYFALGHRLVVTDGLEFNFFDPPNSEPTRILLVNKPVTAIDWGTLEPSPVLQAKFSHFFEAESPRQISEDELVKAAAARARELSQNISELSMAPIGSGLNDHENQAIKVLHDLKGIVEQHHDPRLNDKKAFSDFVAQVLIFGLLYSHRIIENPDLTPTERYEKINRFWFDAIYQVYTEKLRPFRALIELLQEELNSLGPIGTWYQDCCLLFAYIRLDQNQTSIPDYHKLYEKFLSIFDPKTRFDFGAFYTPKELAKFSVKAVQAIVENELNLCLYGERNKLIDPCCGTGTFLEQLLITSEQSNLPKIIGFEILPAPYALAHYRIGMLSRGHVLPQNLSIILTNTLSDDLEREYSENEHGSLTLVEEEQAVARELAKPPLTLVIGNPPSSDSSAQSPTTNLQIIENLLQDFRPPVSERSTRQNIQKQTANEFSRFLRWSCNKVLLSKPGIVALVLPSSFAEQGSYLYARKWLIQNFPKLWILDIDKDGRTGVQSNSIFNTLQGRVLLIAYTGMSADANKTTQLKYGTIADLDKREKLEELSRDRTPSQYTQMFNPLTIDASAPIFRPVKPFDLESYRKYWALYPEHQEPEDGECYIFARHCSGLKLAPSSIFVHTNRSLLIRKLQDISNLSLGLDKITERWFTQQSRPPSDEKLSEKVRAKMGQIQNDGTSIKCYSYRPFTTVWALISEPLLRELASVGGGGTRYRPEVLSAFNNSATIGFAVAPAPKDLGDKLHRFVSFCWNLPDNDLCRRGNAHVFCNLFPEYKEMKSDWNSQPIDNISPMLLKELNANFQVTTDEIVYYVYAILCSDAFLEKFEGALFHVAGAEQRPRIPIAKERDWFVSISSKGKKLAELEKEDSTIKVCPEFEALIALFDRPFSLTAYQIDEDLERLELISEGASIIKISPVSRAILRFDVSGYNVLSQWLKLRTHCYKRTKFDEDDYRALLQLLSKISEQLKIIADLDNDVKKLISGEISLLPAVNTFPQSKLF